MEKNIITVEQNEFKEFMANNKYVKLIGEPGYLKDGEYKSELAKRRDYELYKIKNYDPALYAVIVNNNLSCSENDVWYNKLTGEKMFNSIKELWNYFNKL